MQQSQDRKRLEGIRLREEPGGHVPPKFEPPKIEIDKSAWRRRRWADRFDHLRYEMKMNVAAAALFIFIVLLIAARIASIMSAMRGGR